MDQWYIGLSLGITSSILGLLLLLIGTSTVMNRPSMDRHLSVFSFGVWWLATGVLLLTHGATMVLDALWRPEFALHATINTLSIFLLCVALFCISHYFLYLLVGPQRLWIPLAVFYTVAAFTMIYLVNLQRPIGLDLEAGQVNLAFQDPLSPGLLRRALLLLMVPPALGFIGYLSLYKRLPLDLQKWRLAATAVLILTLIANALVTRVFDFREVPALPLLLRIIGVIAAALLLATYHPPKALRKRLGLSKPSSQSPPPGTET